MLHVENLIACISYAWSYGQPSEENLALTLWRDVPDSIYFYNDVKCDEYNMKYINSFIVHTTVTEPTRPEVLRCSARKSKCTEMSKTKII